MSANGIRRGIHRWLIFGANTDVGKTVFSRFILNTAALEDVKNQVYLKPVQTGIAEGHLDENSVRELQDEGRCIAVSKKKPI